MPFRTRLIYILLCFQPTLVSGRVSRAMNNHLTALISDKRFHYSILVSECADVRKFDTERVTFLRNTQGTRSFHQRQREIVVSCGDERNDNHQVDIAFRLEGVHCGYTNCASDSAAQVIDAFNYVKRTLLIVRTYLRSRLKSRNGVFRYDDHSASMDLTVWKLKRNSFSVKVFSKTFLVVRGPSRERQKDGKTFVFSALYQEVYGEFLFDSTPTRGSPRIGCIETKQFVESDLRRAFVIRKFNHSQQLYFGLHGINVNKGFSLADSRKVPCGKFDIIVTDCHTSDVSIPRSALSYSRNIILHCL